METKNFWQPTLGQEGNGKEQSREKEGERETEGGNRYDSCVWPVSDWFLTGF